MGNLEIFGENLYAIHSIEYQRLEHHYFVFGIREFDRWLSWEETKFYANLLELPTVPELYISKPTKQSIFEQEVKSLTNLPSTFGSIDTQNKQHCTLEGIVSRDIEEYQVADFQHHVFKYVRKGHVKTDEHWTRNWQKAKLVCERRESCGN